MTESRLVGHRRASALATVGATAVEVEIADLRISRDVSAVVKTHALGSCIAVCLYAPARRIAGMIHYMLPSSRANPDRAKSKPAMFADTGVPMLFRSMYQQGCHKTELRVVVAGGGNLNQHNAVFSIGERNYEALVRMFKKNRVSIAAEHVGGRISRTVSMSVETGEVMVVANGERLRL